MGQIHRGRGETLFYFFYFLSWKGAVKRENHGQDFFFKEKVTGKWRQTNKKWLKNKLDFIPTDTERGAFSVHAFLDVIDVPQLLDEQKTSIKGALPEEELTRALKRMKKRFISRLDGITTAFIKLFWCKVKDMVLNSLNAAFTKGEMSATQKRFSSDLSVKYFKGFGVY